MKQSPRLSVCSGVSISMPKTIGTFLPKTSSVVQSSHGRAEDLNINTLFLGNRVRLDLSGLLGKKKKIQVPMTIYVIMVTFTEGKKKKTSSLSPVLV